MRLASYRVGKTESFGIINSRGIIDLGRRLEGHCTNLRSFLAAPDFSAVRGRCEQEDVDYTFSDICWLPVIPVPGQILCVGLNYRAHAAEVGRPMEAHPVIFLRVASSQIGHLEPIVRPKVSELLDYEGELAVVIGKPGRYIEQCDVSHHIVGYSIYNDVSVRDWQRHTHQYTPGKNFPGTGAFGPWMVTPDEVPELGNLEIRTRVNGQTVQDAPLTDMIFSVDEIVSYISNFTELMPGDVILTGTPAGVGSMRKPQLWLKPGDVVEVEISGIGVLRNLVIQEE